MLEQTGLHLGSYPAVPFRLANWTSHGHHCLLDKTPDRMLDIQVRRPLLTPLPYVATLLKAGDS